MNRDLPLILYFLFFSQFDSNMKFFSLLLGKEGSEENTIQFIFFFSSRKSGYSQLLLAFYLSIEGVKIIFELSCGERDGVT